MDYNNIGLKHFKTKHNLKLKYENDELKVSVHQNFGESLMMIPNIKFIKGQSYILNLNVILNGANIYLSICKKKYPLIDGANKIKFSVKESKVDIIIGIIKSIIGTGFILGNLQITPKVNLTLKEEHFSDNHGFGSYKASAIEILKNVISILNEFKINHFLISGTLLGYVRHNDFIPWDDDIDLIVDSSINEKLPKISEKYKNILFGEKNAYVLKVYNKDGLKTPYWWTFPFVDLFVYTEDDALNFFNKKWPIDRFFPMQNVDFLGINVNIPADPHHFLQMNYGEDYMITWKSSNYCHRTETYRGKTHILKNNVIL